MPGRWEGAYIAHILTYNAIMYAIRQNIAGGVGVAARRYNYSTQPQERMLPLWRKKETKYVNQCCGSATDPDPVFFTSMRIIVRLCRHKKLNIYMKNILYVIKHVVSTVRRWKIFLRCWNNLLIFILRISIPNTDSDPNTAEPDYANPRHWLQNTQLSISRSVCVLVWGTKNDMSITSLRFSLHISI